MDKFLIFWGVGGGYGGLQNAAVIFAGTYEDAMDEARERSYDECRSYALDECDTDADEEEKENWDEYQELDSWADYAAEPWIGDEKQRDKAEGYDFSNETIEEAS